MGDGEIRQGAAFIVSAEGDSKYAVRMLRGEGWTVLTGKVVPRRARRALLAGSRRIILGHGEREELWLACGGRRASERWLWVGMRQPPRDARLYLYSCWCGCRLAPALRTNFVVGHYNEVPIPTRLTRAVVLPFLSKVFQLMTTHTYRTPASLRRPLKPLAAQLVATHYFTAGGGLEWVAAALLSASLYRKSCK